MNFGRMFKDLKDDFKKSVCEKEEKIAWLSTEIRVLKKNVAKLKGKIEEGEILRKAGHFGFLRLLSSKWA